MRSRSPDMTTSPYRPLTRLDRDVLTSLRILLNLSVSCIRTVPKGVFSSVRLDLPTLSGTLSRISLANTANGFSGSVYFSYCYCPYASDPPPDPGPEIGYDGPLDDWLA